MSKETFNDLASKATAGGTSFLAIIGFLAWQELSSIKTSLATHIAQTNTLIQRLETRIENLEKRVGEIKADIR
jgi:hypothetical protein